MCNKSEVISLKTVVVGNGLVGKTSMIITHRTGEFPAEVRPMVADNGEHLCQVDGIDFSLLVWDTGGGKDYHRIRPLAYPGKDCFLLLFDASIKDDFDEIKSIWLKELKHHCPKVPVILVASKIDLRETKEIKTISTEKGKEMAKKIIGAAKYMELSSLNKVGLKELFDEAIRIGYAYHIAPKEEQNVVICTVL